MSDFTVLVASAEAALDAMTVSTEQPILCVSQPDQFERALVCVRRAMLVACDAATANETVVRQCIAWNPPVNLPNLPCVDPVADTRKLPVRKRKLDVSLRNGKMCN